MQQEARPQWVTLHMVKDASEVSNKPATITGVLMAETADKFAIGCMLEFQRTPSGVVQAPAEGLNFILKRHVWRVEQLQRQPEFGKTIGDDEDLDDPDNNPFGSGLGGL